MKITQTCLGIQIAKHLGIQHVKQMLDQFLRNGEAVLSYFGASLDWPTFAFFTGLQKDKA